jgi:hypothetical protein
MEIKETPMLFSEPMVCAIEDYTKTWTRRTRKLDQINVFPDRWIWCGWEDDFVIFKNVDRPAGVLKYIKCPYGKPGDLIWVRETFSSVYTPEHEGFTFSHFSYQADRDPLHTIIKWKPSRHMPKVAARIWLKIISINLERLQDITEKEAEQEGVLLLQADDAGKLYKDYLNERLGLTSPVASFMSLWTSINGIQSRKNNPWVWAIHFKKVEHNSGISSKK